MLLDKNWHQSEIPILVAPVFFYFRAISFFVFSSCFSLVTWREILRDGEANTQKFVLTEIKKYGLCAPTKQYFF